MAGSFVALRSPHIAHAFDKISLKHGNISHTDTLAEIEKRREYMPAKHNQSLPVTIREARLGDVEGILQLGNTVSEFQVSDDVITFWPEHIVKKIVSSKTDFIIVAVERKHIVGFIIANYNPTFGKAIIENIYVDPLYRGKGVSDRLRDYLLEKLRSVGCEYVCTLVESAGRDAITSYERYGFNHGIDCVWLDFVLDDSFTNKGQK